MAGEITGFLGYVKPFLGFMGDEGQEILVLFQYVLVLVAVTGLDVLDQGIRRGYEKVILV